LKLRRGLRCFVYLMGTSSLAGCASRSNTAYIEIENDQAGMGKRAEPVIVDSGVEVLQNEYRRSSVNDGSNILQKIRIRGPIMIVPAPAASQPAR
jgi:hypothetical protein